jgi:hypothetical protein
MARVRSGRSRPPGRDIRSRHRWAPAPGGYLHARHAAPSRRRSTPIDGITLRDERVREKRAPSRRSARPAAPAV